MMLNETCTPTPSLLGTNFVPSYDQSLQLHHVLAEKEADLARLNDEVKCAQAHLDRVTRERDSVLRYVETHRALLAPVRRMPLEIMQEVFIHCLPSDQYIRPDAYKAPLLLAQVCVPWRRAVLSTPKLWNSLAIQLSHGNSERRITLMQSWLSRSSGHPISLFAYIPNAGDKAIQAFLRIFTSNTHRWKNLRLTLPNRCRAPVLKALNDGTHQLEALQLRFSPLSSEDSLSPPEQLAVTNLSAPNLRSLTWSSQGLQRVTFAFQMTHITDLDVEHPCSVPDCLAMMQQCLQLIRCEFRAVTQWAPSTSTSTSLFSSGAASDTITPLPDCVLPHLRSLSIHTTQPLGSLFDRIAVPKLHTLKIVDTGHDSDFRVWSQSRFNDLIARSSCALESLHLLNVLPSEDALVQCLQWTSNSLVELRLLDLKGVTVVMDRALSVLTVREGRDGEVLCTCPKLEVVKLGTSLMSSDGMLAAMVESRWKWASAAPRTAVPAAVGASLSGPEESPAYNPGRYHRGIVRLKSINPRLDAVTHPEDVRRLALLRKEGLELL